MSAGFTHVWPLALLLPLVVLGIVLLRTSRGKSRYFRVTHILMPMLASAAFILAIANPWIALRGNKRPISVLLDLSSGTRGGPWRTPPWLHQLLLQHISPQRKVTIIGFAGAPRLLIPPTPLANIRWPKRWPRLHDAHANLSAAMRFGSLGDHAAPPRWIVTNGLLSWPKLPKTVGVPPAVTMIEAGPADIGVARISLRETSFGGKPRLTLSASVRATGKLAGVVRILEGQRLLASRALRFHHAGTKFIRWTLKHIPSGPQTFAVDLRARDLWPEDNRASIAWLPPAPQRTWFVARKPPRKVALASLPRGCKFVPADRFFSGVDRLSNVAEIVLWNVARADLPPNAGQTLRDFVADTGGGLLIVGGSRAFGPGGYYLSTRARGGVGMLDRLSPLASMPPRPPPRQVVFLLDASGSMGETAGVAARATRFALAAQAIQEAAKLLAPRDRLAIVIFHGNARVVLAGKAVATRRKIAARLARIIPTGPTIVDAALPILRRLLRPHALLVLLTDGQIPKIDIAAWRATLATANTRLVLMAPFSEHGTLHRLAKATGGRYVHAGAPAQWTALLPRTVGRHLAGKARDNALAWRTNAGRRLFGQTDTWIRVWMKSRASKLAGGIHPRVPLAATWRVGLGRVAAAAFTDKSASYAALIREMLAGAAPPPGDRRFHIRAVRRDGRWTIRVDAYARGTFLSPPDVALRLIGTGGTTTRQRMRQIGPGGYDAALRRVKGAATAVIAWKNRGRWHYAGRVALPRLPGPGWPATGRYKPCPWRRVVRLPWSPRGGRRWQPRPPDQPRPLRPYLALAGVGLLIGALVATAWRAGA